MHACYGPPNHPINSSYRPFTVFAKTASQPRRRPPDQPLGANGAIEMARKGNMDWCSRVCEKDRRSSQQVAQRCGYNALKREVLDP